MIFSDPRDGDLEDDASSTVSKTLLGHAAGMLVEISFPKLALAIFSLIVLPALTVGAAPIALAWYLRTVADKISVGFHLSFGLLVLAVALFVAWYWGLRALRFVEQSFWNLGATLVQPLYTAIRELIGRAIEAASPDRRYAAARASAGVIAGVLIALGAAAVAWALGPLPRFVVPLAAPQDVWPAAEVALRNAAWAVAAYVMVAAPAWALAETWAGTPRDLPKDWPEGTPRWCVAHLSDIHLVSTRYGFRLECGRDGPRGNGRFLRAMDLLEAEHAARPLDWILITGDITDAARSEEFVAFDEAMAAHPALRERTLIIPGNHDVNIVDRANPARLELPIAPGGTLRRLRMLAAMATLQGGRVHLVDRGAKRLGPTLDDYLAADGRAAMLARFMDRGRLRDGHDASAVWDAIFPLVAPPTEPDGLGVLLLDSNGRTHFSFTNALGIVDATQMHAAEAAMRQFPAARWLVCLHHHLVEYPRPGAKLADRIGTALVNGHWVVWRLRRQAQRLVALHGHRHYDWMGECGGVRILSAPSPVMGAKDPEARWFWLHGFAPGEGGALEMLAPRRVVVPGE
ncbi:metallophosphoesterase [Roseomonas sp. AR75]|uniref:metallophosphoesterase family protein n=1 Tax=Roseomonas sp. AR75 TaxID=2562311 RepID=UPI0010BFCCB3|nr:metallophosphoesterase [Roseomonas sp. AR75]